jgi:ferritin
MLFVKYLHWFLQEQREEVSSMSELLSVVRRAADNLLLVEEFLVRRPVGDAGAVDTSAPPAAGGAL